MTDIQTYERRQKKGDQGRERGEMNEAKPTLTASGGNESKTLRKPRVSTRRTKLLLFAHLKRIIAIQSCCTSHMQILWDNTLR